MKSRPILAALALLPLILTGTSQSFAQHRKASKTYKGTVPDNGAPVAQERGNPPSPPPPPPQVFRFVEQMPSFPGDMPRYLADSIRYPETDKKNGVQGRVAVEFVVMKDGTLDNVHVVRSVSPTIDSEAVRVVRAMPRWNPGKQNGTPVNTFYTLPLTFKME